MTTTTATTMPQVLADAWQARTRPVDGGHLAWTGPRQTASGTPVLRHQGRMHTAARLAFTLRTGRAPVGHVTADCDHPHCIAPDHVLDTAERQRTRQQLHYLTGGHERPATCRHGHDQAQHGRIQPDGRPYCAACKAIRRAPAAMVEQLHVLEEAAHPETTAALYAMAARATHAPAETARGWAA